MVQFHERKYFGSKFYFQWKKEVILELKKLLPWRLVEASIDE